ncbi:MAG: glycosyltransferase family 2 protein [Flavobacteriales bacterium]
MSLISERSGCIRKQVAISVCSCLIPEMLSSKDKEYLLIHRYRMPKEALWKPDRLNAFAPFAGDFKVHVDQVGPMHLDPEKQHVDLGHAPALLGVKGWVAFAGEREVEHLVIEMANHQFIRVIDIHQRKDVLTAFKTEFSNAIGFRFLYPNEFIPLGESDAIVHLLFKDGSRLAKKSISLNKEIGLNGKHHQMLALEHEVFAQSSQLSNLYLSKSWRWTYGFRRFIDLVSKVRHIKNALIMGRDTESGLEKHEAYKQLLSAILDSGRSAAEQSRASQRRMRWENDYQHWQESRQREWKSTRVNEVMEAWEFRPLISVVVPVYNVSARWLNRCIESVLAQAYPNWELCLYDDASSSDETLNALESWRGRDGRIHIEFGTENLHISMASNRAIEMANGEFIALLDNDDEISEDALFHVVKALNLDPQTDMFFSDEDKLEMDGRLGGAYFKPGFNKHLFWANNYLCHFTVIRKSEGDKIGWFRSGFEGAQDFDLFLRLSRITDRIKHIPKVLYHWRKIPGSTATDYSYKGYANASSLKAISEHLNSLGIDGSVHNGQWMGSYRIKYAIVGRPLVSIIIPFKDGAEMLNNCINSILELTKYSNYELLLVNNGSQQQETLKLLEALSNEEKVRIIEHRQPFNFSEINNRASSVAKGEYLVFLNNDTKVIAHDWLSAMLEYAQQDDTGAVGAKLLYQDCTIQHAGVLLGVGGVATHAFHGFADGDNFAFGQMNIVKEYMAVSAACMMVSKSKFLMVGGMDENLPIAYNDVDLCLKFREQGWVNVYTPYAKLFHFESKSRGYDNTPDKRQRLQFDTDYLYSKWGNVAKEDVYYNSNLTKEVPDFSISSQ